jgi:hypothetical protein
MSRHRDALVDRDAILARLAAALTERGLALVPGSWRDLPEIVLHPTSPVRGGATGDDFIQHRLFGYPVSYAEDVAVDGFRIGEVPS